MIEMEYADGGNLAEFLVKQTVRMEEKDILGSNQFSSPKCSYLKCADTVDIVYGRSLAISFIM